MGWVLLTMALVTQPLQLTSGSHATAVGRGGLSPTANGRL